MQSKEMVVKAYNKDKRGEFVLFVEVQDHGVSVKVDPEYFAFPVKHKREFPKGKHFFVNKSRNGALIITDMDGEVIRTINS